MSYPLKIQNCEPSWQFVCPQTWDNLHDTVEQGVRRCHECKKNVYMTHTMSDVIKLTKEGKCVAFVDEKELEPPVTIGEGPLDFYKEENSEKDN